MAKKGATLDGKNSRGESAVNMAKAIANSTKSSASKSSGGKKK